MALLLLPLLLCSVLLARSHETEDLNRKIEGLRRSLDNPRLGLAQKGDLYLELATSLQKLNHLKPDGGKRIAEAERAYRCASHVRAALNATCNAMRSSAGRLWSSRAS